MPRRREQLASFVAAMREPVNGELRELEVRLGEFETRLGMSSATMRARLEAGTLRETQEVCEWLILLDVKDNLGKKRPCSR